MSLENNNGKPDSTLQPNDRLSSWKEVAAYFNVSVRTAQRWEQIEGLPLHRHRHADGSTICAFRPELEEWRKKRYSSMDHSGVDPQSEKVSPGEEFEVQPAPAGPVDKHSLAILPFVNFSDDREDVYFSDGLAEEIINRLTKIPDLHVTARTSSFAFRGKEQDIRQIGTILNVETILEGSLARIGSRIRITVQLINVANGYHLWSELYDRELTDVFAIQDEICQAIVEKFRVHFQGDQSPVNRHSENMEAYTLFLQGHYYQYRFDHEGVEKSRGFFERAIAADPHYALAYIGIAMYHCMRGYLCLVAPREAFSQSEAALVKALEVDSSISEAHAMQGSILLLRDYDWKGAEKAFRRALELDPTSLDSRDLYNFYFLVAQGRLDEALAKAERELPRDPLSAWLHFRLGYRHLMMRNLDRAESHLRKTLELDPDYCAGYYIQGTAFFLKEKFDEAVQSYEKHTELCGRDPWGLGTLGYAYARTGRVSEARKILRELQKLARIRYVAPSSFAKVYFGLGNNDRGFEFLEKAVEDRDPTIIHIAPDPFFDFIRPDPRFRKLLGKMNL